MATPSRFLRSVSVFVLLASISLGISCGDGGGPTTPDPARATSVSISPGSISFDALGQAHQLTATVRDQNGQPMQGVTIVWSSSAQGVALVDASGRVTPVASGQATINASAGGISGSAAVTVALLEYTLTVGRTDGVSGSPGAGEFKHYAGTQIPYSFGLEASFQDLTVYLNDDTTTSAGTLMMDGNKVLAALAMPIPVVPPGVQAEVHQLTESLKGLSTGASRPMDAYRAIQATLETLAARVPVDSIPRLLRLARLGAYTYEALPAVAQALLEIGDSLALRSEATPSAAPAAAMTESEIVFLYVNGIWTDLGEATTTASLYLPPVVRGAGYADRSRYPVKRFHNPGSRPEDIDDLKTLLCIEGFADRFLEGSLKLWTKCETFLVSKYGSSDLQQAFGQVLARVLTPPVVTGIAEEFADSIQHEAELARVVVVAHSQGNLMTHAAYRELESRGGVNPRCIGTVSLAPPGSVIPLSGGFSPTGSFVSGDNVEDILLLLGMIFPTLYPTIWETPQGSNWLSDDWDLRVNELSEFWRGLFSAGYTQLMALILTVAADLNLHGVNNDYLTAHRPTVENAIRIQAENVLRGCVGSMQVEGPGSGAPNVALPTVTVRALGPGGSPAGQVNVSVTVSLGSNPPSATLSGTKTVKMDNGVAKFSDLVIDKEGSGYTLVFSAPGGVTASTAPFNITTAVPPSVATVTVSPSSASIAVGAAQQFTAIPKDAAGNTLTGRTVVWSSSNTPVATVNSSTGLATGVAAGTSTITATSEGVSGSAMLTVKEKSSIEVRGPIISATGFQTCGITTGGSTYCWGSMGYGQSQTSPVDGLTPFLLDGVLNFVTVAEGEGGSHACGITEGGEAFCWGSGSAGQLGNGSPNEQLSPQPVSGGFTFSSVSAGTSHTCGVANHVGYCWGTDHFGGLGSGGSYSPVPRAVSGGLGFSSISAGTHHSCGLTTAGEAYCWGLGDHGLLGNGSSLSHDAPVPVSGGFRFSAISVGGTHSCAISLDGSAYCWGVGAWGALGNGSTVSRFTPVPVAGGLRFRSLSSGAIHTCGVTTEFLAYCWGVGEFGQLGNGSYGYYISTVPVPVSGGLTFSEISAGDTHTCAIATDGKAYCWGRGHLGALGNGGTEMKTTPYPVSGGLTFRTR